MKQKNTDKIVELVSRSTPVARKRPQDGRSPDEGYFDTLISNMPQMSDLFSKLSAGEHPDFFAVMSAISEMVAFYTECDSNCDDDLLWLLNMSQKKCRFCS